MEIIITILDDRPIVKDIAENIKQYAEDLKFKKSIFDEELHSYWYMTDGNFNLLDFHENIRILSSGRAVYKIYFEDSHLIQVENDDSSDSLDTDQ